MLAGGPRVINRGAADDVEMCRVADAPGISGSYYRGIDKLSSSHSVRRFRHDDASISNRNR